MAKPQPKEQENESVASILSKIKSMVSGKEKIVIEDDKKPVVTKAAEPEEDEDALELTEIVEADSVAETSQPTEAQMTNAAEVAQPEEEKFVDLLQEIDQALEAEYKNEGVVEATAPTIEAAVENAAEQTPDAAVLEDMQAKIAAELSAPEAVTAPPQAVEANANLAQAPVQNKPEPVVEPKKQFTELSNSNIITSQKPSAMDTEKRENILSQDIAARSSKAIQGLLNNLPKPAIDSPAFRNAITIEDLVMETMKPLLKEWLDSNLETIVRDIVEREIRKLIPRE